MKKIDLMKGCNIKLDDKVKIMLCKVDNILSNETYTVTDILATYSLKNENVTFEVIVTDYMGRVLHPFDIESLKVV